MRNGTRGLQTPETYTDRDATLRGMGYATYREYLESPLWAKIRTKVLLKRGTHCCVCMKKEYSDIHHISYAREVLEGVRIGQIVPVCGSCHLDIEFLPDGRKRTLQEAKVQYSRMLNKTTHLRKNMKPKRSGYLIAMAMKKKHMARKYGRRRR